MFENVDGRTDGRRTTDAGVTGILIAHLEAFGSGELKIMGKKNIYNFSLDIFYLNLCISLIYLQLYRARHFILTA